MPGFWPAFGVFVLLAFAAGAAVTALLVAASGFVETGAVQRLDERVLRWFADRRSPLLDPVMSQVTTLGDGIVVIMLVAVTSLFLWLTRHHWSVYLLLVGVAGGQLVNNVLKLAFGRARPDVVEWIGHASTPSFPSGHAMSAFIAYGSIAYLVGRLEARPAVRRATWLATSVLILAIGISRVHLGVHYPSDVLGGFIAGGAWLTLVAASVTALRFFAPRRPATAGEERGIEGGTRI